MYGKYRLLTLNKRACSGKSTVGKIVAAALGYPYLDIDAIIVETAGCTVAQIFADQGEQAFRDLESQVLQVCLSLALWCSCGWENVKCCFLSWCKMGCNGCGYESHWEDLFSAFC